MHDCTGSDSSCMSIYSLGDAGFMKDILNGVAMIHGSGSFYQAAASALLFGFLIMIFKSLLNGALRISFGEIFICWLLYMIMFVPKTTVVVEDLYSDRVYTVDNVPVGIAFPGHAISTVGFGFAQLLEQGFGTVHAQHGITREPFLESMYVINRLKDYDLLSRLWAELDVKIGPSSDSRSSWQNYLSDCIMTKYRFFKNSSAGRDARLPFSEVVKSFPSKVYGTVIYRDSPLEITCSDAQSSLLRDLALLTSDDAGRILAGGSVAAGPAGHREKMEQALSLLAASAADKLNIVRAALLMPLYDRAAEGYFQNADDVLTAATVEQSVSQRNTQWALEQSLFMSTVKPFVSFFEAFVYAITPFAAVLICIGSFGIRLAVRYLQILVWLQLWWPILAIINLYITAGVSGELSSALDGTPADSFYALNCAWKIAESWMATAGMLASATPLIAFFLVSGSAYSFTTLTGRMQGSDHIAESAVSPDVLSQGAMLSNSAGTIRNSASGRLEQGREAQLATINLSRELSESAASSLSRMQSVQSSLNSTVQSAWGHALGSSSSSSASQSYSSILAGSSTTAAGRIGAMADQIADSFNLSRDQRNMVASQIAQNYLAASTNSIAVAAQAAVGSALGVKLDFTHSNSWTDSESSGTGSTSGFSAGMSAGSGSSRTFGMNVSASEQKSLQDSITRQTAAMSSTGLSDVFSRNDQESIARQYQSLLGSQKSYSESSALSERFGSGFSLNEKEAADAVVTAGNGAAVLAGYQQMSSAEKNAAKKEEGRLLALGMDRQHARTAAVIAAAASSGEHSAGAAAVLNALGGSLNSSVVSSDPRSASSIPSPSSAGSGGPLASAVAAGSAAAGVRVGAATGALAADFSARSGSVAGSYSTASSQIDSGMSAAAVRMASENIHDPSESAYDLANITGGSELDFRLKSSAVSAFSEIGGGGFMYLNPNYPQNETEFHSVLSSAVNANPNLDSGMKKMLTEGSTGSASVLSGGKPLHTFADGKAMTIKEKNYFDSRGISYDSDHAGRLHQALQSFYRSAYKNHNAVSAAKDIRILEHL